MRREQRKWATIVAADVVGYSASRVDEMIE